MLKGFRQWRFLWVTILVLLVDFITKNLANHVMSVGQSINLFPGLNLTLVHNTGAAFGLLAQAGGWQKTLFIIVAIVVAVVILVWLRLMKTSDRVTAIALCLILGGALGNLYSRIIAGYVTDFIDVYYKVLHWPSFNIADSAITIGVILLIWSMFRKST